MIIIKIMGGLGNQMFQYAFAKAQAIRNKTELLLDLSGYNSENNIRKYELDVYNLKYKKATKDVLLNVNFPSKKILTIYKNIFGKKNFKKTYEYFKEKTYEYNSELKKANNRIYFDGYWQSEKYFKEYKEIIINEFTLKDSLNSKAEEYKKKILTVNSISLHIRRGDYVSNEKTNSYHGTCSLEYYEKAISFFQNKLLNPCIFIFTDDIKWVTENITYNIKMKIVDLSNVSTSDAEEMYLMSLCKHNIIANSSFSWWGAWLNKNPDKIVIAPKKWFNDEAINTNDLIPEEWMRF